MPLRKIKRFFRTKLGHEIVLVGAVVLVVSTGIILTWISTFKIPDLSSFESRLVSESTKIYDKTGKVLLYDVHQGAKRSVVSYEEISRNVKNATVAIEDSEFYEHGGIKVTAIIRAILANILNIGYSQGGSTITQQVVKNSLLTQDKTITRKLKEWVLALKLEQVLDKESILALYLNESPYGGNIYGIEEASQAFFGKKSSEVSLVESAYLAALPNAPTYYSPYGSNPKRLEDRKNLVLKRMLENKFITEEEYRKALKERVEFLPQDSKGIKAPHFVMFVREYLENKYGTRALEESGLKVTTTLDYDLQIKAEEIVKKFALENKDNFNASNASLVAIDPKTGGILVMVGSRDYFDTEIDGNFNVAIAHRQPGSSFKPFVYATAFNKGYTPETVVFDLKTQFDTSCPEEDIEKIELASTTEDIPCYIPENYDGQYRGPITLKEALAQSINVPAIKTLYLAGLKDSLQTAQEMGIESLGDPNQYGLTLVLGGGEVSLLDMTSAYGVFANKGERNPHQGVLKVEDRNGNVLESLSVRPKRVLPEQVALQISNVLSDEAARAPAFGNHSYLYFDNRDVAVKTGTTNDYKDAWIIGYTPAISVGAWAGNNDNSPMEKKVAGFIVAPMWNAFMQEVNNKSPTEKFTPPTPTHPTGLKPVLRGIWQGGISYYIDRISGKRATEYTPKELVEEKVIRNVHSILYWLDKSDPNGPKPEHPENDGQFKLWEYSVSKWATAQSLIPETESVIPKEVDSVHNPELSPKIKILSLSTDVPFKKSDRISVSISNSSRYPLQKVDFFFNGIYLGTSKNFPFNFSFTPEDVETVLAENEFKVIGYDTVLNKGETVIKIKVTP